MGGKLAFTYSFVDHSEQLFDNDENYVIYSLAFSRQLVMPTPSFAIRYDFKNAFIQAEAGAQFRRTQFDFINYYLPEEDSRLVRKSAAFLRVPVLGGIQFGNFKLGVGPTFSFKVFESEPLGFLPEVEERFSSFEPTATILIGYNVENVCLGFSYEYHFHGVNELLFYKNLEKGFEQRPHFLSINAAFFIRR